MVTVPFQFVEDFLGAVDNGFRQTGQFTDVDAVAFIDAAGQDLAQENHFALLFFDGDVIIFHTRQIIGQGNHFMIVGSEEGFSA